MKAVSVLVSASFLTILVSCGPNEVVVESGRQATCELEKAIQALELDPENRALQEEVKQHQTTLDNIIEISGDPETYTEAIQEAMEEKGCE